MKTGWIAALKWLIPVALVLLGLCLSGANTTGFLGLICYCLTGLVTVYFLIGLLRPRHLSAAKLLNIVLTALLLLGICVVTVTAVVVADAAVGQPEVRCDYVLILGAKVNGTEPSRTLRERIDAAYDYLLAHPDSIAVASGGQGSDEGISEAQCIFNALTAKGISPERIWMETGATSTWENLNYSLELIRQKTGVRPERIALVSSEYHLFRASLFARDCGVSAVCVPGKTGDPVHFLNYFLREIAGVWHYWILGGLYHD